ncbi:hypothetical protein PR048_026588 [Dryococelus australis]|uniref:Uncharacterized protein n=1 Tax=Dryococelus australis TaxID=614101 RepID=A0ABQ9GLQ9_9NEOP|nr:hypothetical protein PR048_026588 [Dryococelus australis]
MALVATAVARHEVMCRLSLGLSRDVALSQTVGALHQHHRRVMVTRRRRNACNMREGGEATSARKSLDTNAHSCSFGLGTRPDTETARVRGTTPGAAVEPSRAQPSSPETPPPTLAGSNVDIYDETSVEDSSDDVSDRVEDIPSTNAVNNIYIFCEDSNEFVDRFRYLLEFKKHAKFYFAGTKQVNAFGRVQRGFLRVGKQLDSSCDEQRCVLSWCMSGGGGSAEWIPRECVAPSVGSAVFQLTENVFWASRGWSGQGDASLRQIVQTSLEQKADMIWCNEAVWGEGRCRQAGAICPALTDQRHVSLTIERKRGKMEELEENLWVDKEAAEVIKGNVDLEYHKISIYIRDGTKQKLRGYAISRGGEYFRDEGDSVYCPSQTSWHLIVLVLLSEPDVVALDSPIKTNFMMLSRGLRQWSLRRRPAESSQAGEVNSLMSLGEVGRLQARHVEFLKQVVAVSSLPFAGKLELRSDSCTSPWQLLEAQEVRCCHLPSWDGGAGTSSQRSTQASSQPGRYVKAAGWVVDKGRGRWHLNDKNNFVWGGGDPGRGNTLRVTGFPAVILGCSGAGIGGRGKREYPERTLRQAASSSTIPTCESPGAGPPGIEPGLPWCEASKLATAPPLPHLNDATHNTVVGTRHNEYMLLQHRAAVHRIGVIFPELNVDSCQGHIVYACAHTQYRYLGNCNRCEDDARHPQYPERFQVSTPQRATPGVHTKQSYARHPHQ